MKRIKDRLFGGDPEKEFRWALASFCLVVMTIMLGVGSLLYVRGESFTKACEEVQANNVLFVDYLHEAKDRALDRISSEEAEGKTPLSSKEEINLSFEPLLTRLKPVTC